MSTPFLLVGWHNSSLALYCKLVLLSLYYTYYVIFARHCGDAPDYLANDAVLLSLRELCSLVSVEMPAQFLFRSPLTSDGVCLYCLHTLLILPFLWIPVVGAWCCQHSDALQLRCKQFHLEHWVHICPPPKGYILALGVVWLIVLFFIHFNY